MQCSYVTTFWRIRQALAVTGLAVTGNASLRTIRGTTRHGAIRDAAGVRAKFGVEPALIPDFLALVGDAADGYPGIAGIAGIGAVGAARLLERHGPIEAFPPEVLGGERREQALLFKQLATLRSDAVLFDDVERLRWRGPTPGFAAWAQRMNAPRLLERCLAAQAALKTADDVDPPDLHSSSEQPPASGAA